MECTLREIHALALLSLGEDGSASLEVQLGASPRNEQVTGWRARAT